MQLVALAALRTRPPDRLRGPADATPNAANAAAVKDASAAAATAAAAKSSTAATAANDDDSSASASATVKRRRTRSAAPAEREMAGRRFGDQSRRQAHAVYL